MLKYLESLLIILLLVTCSDNDTVTIVKEHGALTGTVLPIDIGAVVHIKQGEYVITVAVNNDGRFFISNVAPGIYTFIVKAPNFGTYKLENLKIEDGEGYEIGITELNNYPYPLSGVYPEDITLESFYSRMRVMIEFSKYMDFSSIQNSIGVIPAVDNIVFVDQSFTSRDNGRYYIHGDFKAGIDYTISLDTTIQTFWGEKLEFPYSFNFSTEAFKVLYLDTTYLQGSMDLIRIKFNNSLGNDFAEHLLFEPDIALEMQNNSNSIGIRPINSWVADTTFNISISNLLEDRDGNKLLRDTTLSFSTPPLSVLRTIPANQQKFVQDLVTVSMEMNYLIDYEILFSSECISISPTLDFITGYSIQNNRTTIQLVSGEFLDNTEYTVTINTKLKDYWGKNLKEPYEFKFTTN